MAGARKRILFVDDEPQLTDALSSRLHDYRAQWDMVFLNEATVALDYAVNHDLDTIITDVRMPVMDGLELIARLREQPRHRLTPIVVLTGDGDKDLKRHALDAGADDLLNKPVVLEDLVARLRSALRLKEQQDQLQAANALLESRVAQRTQQLAMSRLDIILRLARAAEYRDEDTGNHIVRVGLYSSILARGLGLPTDVTKQLLVAAPLHDVGKIGIPDGILLAQRKLTDEEWQTMKRHAEIGYSILTEPSPIFEAFTTATGEAAGPSDTNPLVRCAATVALTHHEKYQGGGYPRGLSGEQIPIEGRIVALADVYDALSSDRPYKRAFPEPQVVEMLAQCVGPHLDPAVHAVFVRERETFRQIREQYGDNATHAPAGDGCSRAD